MKGTRIKKIALAAVFMTATVMAAAWIAAVRPSPALGGQITVNRAIPLLSAPTSNDVSLDVRPYEN